MRREPRAWQLSLRRSERVFNVVDQGRLTGLFEARPPARLPIGCDPRAWRRWWGRTISRARRADRPHGGGGPALLDDPLGSAGLRQDDDRAPVGASQQNGLRAAVGRVLGRGRFAAKCSKPPREPARDGRGHAPLHRRDPPLQPRPAGRLPALCRERHGDARGRHHGEPLLRAQCGTALALPGPCSRRLDDASLEMLVERAEAVEGRKLPLAPEAPPAMRAIADGDGRYVLNMAEELFQLSPRPPLDTRALVPRCSAARRFTTRPRRATTTSSRRCTRACAARTRMPRSTGSRACWRGARTRATWRAG